MSNQPKQSWQPKPLKGAEVLFSRPFDSEIHQGVVVDLDMSSGCWLVQIAPKKGCYVKPANIIAFI